MLQGGSTNMSAGIKSSNVLTKTSLKFLYYFLSGTNVIKYQFKVINSAKFRNYK